MSVTVVAGALWGDEGKGRVCYELARQADVVSRCSGGPNAAHTVMHAGRPVTLRQVPAGIFHPGVLCTTGDGMAINPMLLCDELKALSSVGVSTRSFKLSARAHVITPWHLEDDAARDEDLTAGAIGTTRQGVGPAFADKVQRTGLRLGELFDHRALRSRLGQLARGRRGGVSRAAVERALAAAARTLEPYVDDTGALVRQMARAGARVLLEGSQGALLDVEHGTWPWVTGASTIPASCVAALGLALTSVERVVGVVRAYATRHGPGPFPTEFTAAEEARFRSVTRDWTLRVGWLDVQALRYAAEVAGFTELAVTSLDRLSGLPRVKLGRGVSGVSRGAWSRFGTEGRVRLATLEGWSVDITGTRQYRRLPVEVRVFLDRLEREVGVAVRLVSTSQSGPLLERRPSGRTRRP